MRIAAYGLALAALFAPRFAHGAEEASELPLRLAWEAPARCPNEADVTKRVRQLLSGTPPERTIVVAHGQIREKRDRFELELTTEVGDAHGTKNLGASSCKALAEAAAVFLALAIDALAVEATASETLASDPTKEIQERPAAPPQASIPAPREAPSPSPSPPATPLRFGGGMSALFDLRTLPNAAAGLGLQLHVRHGRARAGVLGTLWHTQEPTFRPNGAGASFEMRSAGVFGCYVVAIGRFGFGPCANVEVTSVKAEGFGIRYPRAVHSIWPTIAAGALAEARLTGWLALVARVDLLAAIASPDVALATDAGLVRLYDRGIFSMRSGLGAEIVLP